MEVHAHTHTERKRFTHYLWEFLMLFLAVTLGFLVENKREHIVEHKRVKEYAESMLDDLKEDTSQLHLLIDRYAYGANCVDSFINLLATQDIKKIPSGKLYWFGLWGGFSNSFVSNDATFQQMRNSGSLRYITNRELSKKISLYDWQIRKIESYTEKDLPIYTETRKTRSMIFDFRYNRISNEIAQSLYLAMASGETFNRQRLDSFTKANPPLLTYDKNVLNQYTEMCRSRSLRALALNLQVTLSLAEELISDIKKEYHLSEGTPLEK